MSSLIIEGYDTSNVDFYSMDRTLAILLFGDRYYISDCDHQEALEEALNMSDIEVDFSNVNECKQIEKDFGMCALDYFQGNIGDFLVIQTNEYLKYCNTQLLRDVYKEVCNNGRVLRVGFIKDIQSSDMILFESLDKFCEFIDEKVKKRVIKMATIAKTENELRRENLENAFKTDVINVDYFKGRCVTDIGANILALLIEHNKIKGVSSLNDLGVTLKQGSDKTLEDIQVSGRHQELDKVISLFEDNVFNPNVTSAVHDDLIELMKLTGFKLIVNSTEKLNDFLWCFRNITEHEEDIYELLGKGQIVIPCEDCMGIAAGYFGDVSGFLLKAILDRELSKRHSDTTELKSMSYFG